LAQFGLMASLVNLVLLTLAQQAMAHHMMDGRLPATFMEGLLSGLGHPVIGLDHLAFVVAIGVLSAGFARGALLPLPFVLAALLGTWMHCQKLNLPLAEPMVAMSVLGLGTLLLLNRRINFAWLAAIAGVAGLFHGYAYGESIVGAEPSPLFAYLLGFSLIQLAIALGAMALTRWLATQPLGWWATWERWLGFVITAIGAVFLVNQ
jgi:urease accessory protein